MNTNVPADNIVVRNARLAVDRELKRKRALNQPIAKFDAKTGKVFMEHSDGSITVVGDAMKKGRYSERRR